MTRDRRGEFIERYFDRVNWAREFKSWDGIHVEGDVLDARHELILNHPQDAEGGPPTYHVDSVLLTSMRPLSGARAMLRFVRLLDEFGYSCVLSALPLDRDFHRWPLERSHRRLIDLVEWYEQLGWDPVSGVPDLDEWFDVEQGVTMERFPR